MGAGSELVERLFEDVWNRGDVDALDHVFSPDVVVHSGPTTESRGRAVFRDVIADWLRAFPDLHHSIDDLVEVDDRAVVRWHGSGTHQAEFSGIAATGRSMSYWGMTWCRIRNGLVAEAWVAANVDEMTASLAAEA